MIMKFVSKDLAIKLRNKGFDRPCFGYYLIEDKYELEPHRLWMNITHRGGVETCLKRSGKDCIDAPTIEQALKWLREEKNIHIGIMPYFTMSTKNNIMWLWEILLVGKIIECENTLYVDKDYNYTKFASADSYANYDDACTAAINFIVKYLI